MCYSLPVFGWNRYNVKVGYFSRVSIYIVFFLKGKIRIWYSGLKTPCPLPIEIRVSAAVFVQVAHAISFITRRVWHTSNDKLNKWPISVVEILRIYSIAIANISPRLRIVARVNKWRLCGIVFFYAHFSASYCVVIRNHFLYQHSGKRVCNVLLNPSITHSLTNCNKTK